MSNKRLDLAKEMVRSDKKDIPRAVGMCAGRLFVGVGVVLMGIGLFGEKAIWTETWEFWYGTVGILGGAAYLWAYYGKGK